MSAVASAFLSGRPALIPFVCAGDPRWEEMAEVIIALGEAGADVVEIGVPFSDPIADGPTIASAYQRSLARGFSVSQVFKLLAEVRRQSSVPLVLFCYCNNVLQYGIERFAANARAAGADAVLVPDLPAQEARDIAAPLGVAGLDMVFLAAPTTSDQRLAQIAACTTGFLYLVAALGVTGARAELSRELATHVKRAKQISPKPVAVGFGISSPQQARAVADLGADGVIVGSALVERLHQWSVEGGEDLPGKSAEFIRTWRAALDQPAGNG